MSWNKATTFKFFRGVRKKIFSTIKPTYHGRPISLLGGGVSGLHPLEQQTYTRHMKFNTND